jgi:hypothetical protein
MLTVKHSQLASATPETEQGCCDTKGRRRRRGMNERKESKDKKGNNEDEKGHTQKTRN